MQQIHVGLIGYGLSGSVFHAPLIHSMNEFFIRTVVSSSPDKVYDDYSYVSVVPSIEELLAEPDIQLVVITSPNSTHYSYAKQALLSSTRCRKLMS
ncbi:MAG: oxidoreductase [Anaerosporomusa subterranea]|nr:oxidoreductase [Anaerosporomusa subterranea]